MVLVAGGVPIIHGDTGLGVMIPIPLMGEGIARLLAILLRIASAPGGTVLVDAIENGLHYSILVNVWQAIDQASKRSNTQVFATTHSLECIRAAHAAFDLDGDRSIFQLLRLDRIDEQIRVVTYAPDVLDTAIVTGLEVR